LESKERDLSSKITQVEKQLGLGGVDPGAPSAGVVLEGLSKTFRRTSGEVVNAIDDISLTVGVSEILVLLGPSGCGKTTLLRCIAGLETPEKGIIRLQNRIVFSGTPSIVVPPERRKIGMIFQSYALWPHMTVLDNVAYPLRVAGESRSDAREAAQTMLAKLSIPELGLQHPGQLSGGQQQRVALARALIRGGSLVLLDEPLSNVDAKVREHLRIELLALQRELGFAAVYVTHDQAEALEIGHRVAVMSQGQILQLSSPAELYRKPINRFVADFVGVMNELAGIVEEVTDEGLMVRTRFGLVYARRKSETPVLEKGDAVWVLWRPESITIVPTPTAATDGDDGGDSENVWSRRENRYLATVSHAFDAGVYISIIFDIEGVSIRAALLANRIIPERGSAHLIAFSEVDVTIFRREEEGEYV